MLLAMDTAQAACSAAVLSAEGTVLVSAFEEMSRGHAERLVPMIGEVLAAADVAMTDLTRVATTVGPGTFTGLRVGLAVARGYGVALDVPVIGVTTLEALAATARLQHPDLASPLVAIIDARRSEVYVQHFAADGSPLTDPVRQSVDAALADLPTGDFAVIGTGQGFVTEAAPLAHPLGTLAPDAQAVGHLALKRPIPAAPPEALYLRAPDAKLPGGVIPPGFEI